MEKHGDIEQLVSEHFEQSLKRLHRKSMQTMSTLPPPEKRDSSGGASEMYVIPDSKHRLLAVDENMLREDRDIEYYTQSQIHSSLQNVGSKVEYQPRTAHSSVVGIKPPQSAHTPAGYINLPVDERNFNLFNQPTKTVAEPERLIDGKSENEKIKPRKGGMEKHGDFEQPVSKHFEQSLIPAHNEGMQTMSTLPPPEKRDSSGGASEMYHVIPDSKHRLLAVDENMLRQHRDREYYTQSQIHSSLQDVGSKVEYQPRTAHSSVVGVKLPQSAHTPAGYINLPVDERKSKNEKIKPRKGGMEKHGDFEQPVSKHFEQSLIPAHNEGMQTMSTLPPPEKRDSSGGASEMYHVIPDSKHRLLAVDENMLRQHRDREYYTQSQIHSSLQDVGSKVEYQPRTAHSSVVGVKLPQSAHTPAGYINLPVDERNFNLFNQPTKTVAEPERLINCGKSIKHGPPPCHSLFAGHKLKKALLQKYCSEVEKNGKGVVTPRSCITPPLVLPANSVKKQHLSTVSVSSEHNRVPVIVYIKDKSKIKGTEKSNENSPEEHDGDNSLNFLLDRKELKHNVKRKEGGKSNTRDQLQRHKLVASNIKRSEENNSEKQFAVPSGVRKPKTTQPALPEKKRGKSENEKIKPRKGGMEKHGDFEQPLSKHFEQSLIPAHKKSMQTMSTLPPPEKRDSSGGASEMYVIPDNKQRLLAVDENMLGQDRDIEYYTQSQIHSSLQDVGSKVEYQPRTAHSSVVGIKPPQSAHTPAGYINLPVDERNFSLFNQPTKTLAEPERFIGGEKSSNHGPPLSHSLFAGHKLKKVLLQKYCSEVDKNGKDVVTPSSCITPPHILPTNSVEKQHLSTVSVSSEHNRVSVIVSSKDKSKIKGTGKSNENSPEKHDVVLGRKALKHNVKRKEGGKSSTRDQFKYQKLVASNIKSSEENNRGKKCVVEGGGGKPKTTHPALPENKRGKSKNKKIKTRKGGMEKHGAFEQPLSKHFEQSLIAAHKKSMQTMSTLPPPEKRDSSGGASEMYVIPDSKHRLLAVDENMLRQHRDIEYYTQSQIHSNVGSKVEYQPRTAHSSVVGIKPPQSAHTPAGYINLPVDERNFNLFRNPAYQLPLGFIPHDPSNLLDETKISHSVQPSSLEMSLSNTTTLENGGETGEIENLNPLDLSLPKSHERHVSETPYLPFASINNNLQLETFLTEHQSSSPLPHLKCEAQNLDSVRSLRHLATQSLLSLHRQLLLQPSLTLPPDSIYSQSVLTCATQNASTEYFNRTQIILHTYTTSVTPSPGPAICYSATVNTTKIQPAQPVNQEKRKQTSGITAGTPKQELRTLSLPGTSKAPITPSLPPTLDFHPDPNNTVTQTFETHPDNADNSLNVVIDRKALKRKVKAKEGGKSSTTHQLKRQKLVANNSKNSEENNSEKQIAVVGGGGKPKTTQPALPENKRGDQPCQKQQRDKPSASPQQRDRFTKPSRWQLKISGESFLQDGLCFEVAPKLTKCIECKWMTDQQSCNMPNNFCRFYEFRRLRYARNGQLNFAGFSDPHRDSSEDDLQLWLAMPDNPPPDLDFGTALFILIEVEKQFCDLLEEENKTISIHMSDDKRNKTIAWKKVVQDVREICDVCATTLFNCQWVCRECGFVVCIDCYKERKNDAESDPGTDRDDLPWLLCTNEQPHKKEMLMLAQSIPADSLLTLARTVRELMATWGIPTHPLTSQVKQTSDTLKDSESDSDSDQTQKKHLLRQCHKPDGSCITSPATIESNTGGVGAAEEGTADEIISSDVENAAQQNILEVPGKTSQLMHFFRQYNWAQKGKEHLYTRTINLTGNKMLYPETPHLWLCDGKVLQLMDSNNPGNYKIFHDQWKTGQPVIVSNVSKHLNVDLWHPGSFAKDFGEATNDFINCLTGKLLSNQSLREFWEGFEYISKRLKDETGCYMLLQLKDWPPGEDFEKILPTRFNDLIKSLPLGEYTRRSGKLNLASRLPPIFLRPDLGPKVYAAYSPNKYYTKGTMKLHLESCDTVNLMVYVGIPKDSEENIEEVLHAIDEAGCDDLSRRRVRDEGEVPGALWHTYTAKDAEKIRTFLNEVASERGVLPRYDPIHDQTWYLDGPLRERLREEYGVESYAVVQCLGDAVFIPAGAPYQVQNLHDCIQVAQDFVSPENISHCFNFTQEIRKLSHKHSNHEDKLQVKNILYHAVKDASSTLTFTGLTQANFINQESMTDSMPLANTI